MSKFMVTERLTLRKLEFKDATALEDLAGEKDVADTTMNMPHPYPIGSAITFIKSRHEAEAQRDSSARERSGYYAPILGKPRS